MIKVFKLLSIGFVYILKHLSVVGASVTCTVLQRARHRNYGPTRLSSPKVPDRLLNQTSLLFRR